MIPDFRDLLAEFVAASVRFLVVGAHALAAHGVPRVTGDLDLWVEPTATNAGRVWTALARFGAPLDTLGIPESDLHAPDRVIQLGLPPYRLDVMTTISGVTFEEAWPGRLEGMLFGISVAFLAGMPSSGTNAPQVAPRISGTSVPSTHEDDGWRRIRTDLPTSRPPPWPTVPGASRVAGPSSPQSNSHRIAGPAGQAAS
jgi:hypothetical protein